jgi:nucleoside 2-deoxyribosyltransferase
MKIYLCGPINGMTDETCKNWRNHAKEVLRGNEFVDPMRHDFRGQEAGNERLIVQRDTQDIESSDVVLACYDRASFGTAMEILLAYQCQIPVSVAHLAPGPPSPWVTHHADFVGPTLESAIQWIKENPRWE